MVSRMVRMIWASARATLECCLARTRLLRALHRRDARRSRRAADLCRQRAVADPYPEVLRLMEEQHEQRAAWLEREARFYERLLRLPPFRSRRRRRCKRSGATNFIRWHMDWH